MRSALALAVVTVLVWGTRVRNIVGEDGGGSLALVVAGGLTALGGVAVVAAVRGRPAWAVPALAATTVVVWAVRAPLIVLDADHALGFKVVHTLLAVGSVALAVVAWRSFEGRRPVRPLAAAGR